MGLRSNEKGLVTLGIAVSVAAYFIGMEAGESAQKEKARPWLRDVLQSQCRPASEHLLCPTSITEWPIDP